MREDDWDHYSDPKIKQQKEEEALLQRLLGPRDVVVTIPEIVNGECDLRCPLLRYVHTYTHRCYCMIDAMNDDGKPSYNCPAHKEKTK